MHQKATCHRQMVLKMQATEMRSVIERTLRWHRESRLNPCPQISLNNKGVKLVTKKEYSKRILKALNEGGGFMNNIIGAILKQAAAEHDFFYADELVIEHSLTKLAGIPTQNSMQDILKNRITNNQHKKDS